MVMSRPQRNGTEETVTVKTVTTGTLAGTHAVEVGAVRQEGESLQECADRVAVVYEGLRATVNGGEGTPFNA
jgi:hypothetical protein